MVRIGIIGMGNMGCTHFSAYEKLEGACVVGFSARDPRRLTGDVSDLWGNLGHARPSRLPMHRLRAVRDAMELIHADDIDAIDICTPTPTHAALIEAAVRAGKHVLCEKPLCRTLEEVVRLRTLIEQMPRGVVVMPAMVVRFMPAYRWLREAIADDRFGRVHAAHFTRLGAMPPGWFADGAASGGAWLDLHLHDVDFICSAFGAPGRVTSRGITGASGAIDHIHTQFGYDGDAPLVTAEVSWLMSRAFPFRARFTVAFERATADYDMARTPQLLVHEDHQSRADALDGADGHESVVRHFVDCLRSGEPPAVTLDDAVLAMRVLESERQSAAAGETVSLAGDRPAHRAAAGASAAS